ncbi:MAG: tetratricopeptide repeat protein, partial [Thaumarchaeota archaeon]|nr:tetratricopeptide repeat protein [Nitrososphaerota archaeon]
LGRYDEAKASARRAVELDNSSGSRLQLAAVLAEAGDKEEARRIIDDAKAASGGGYLSPGMLAIAEFCLGNDDEGFTLLGRAVDEKDSTVLMFGSLPWFREYWQDPRWVSIDKRLGLPGRPVR